MMFPLRRCGALLFFLASLVACENLDERLREAVRAPTAPGPSVPGGPSTPPSAPLLADKVVASDKILVARADDSFASADGLYLFGPSFDPSRPTVIYVHGWTPQPASATFVNDAAWREAGFNTLMYRWHHDSYDPGRACFGPLVPVRCPSDAEQRIWKEAGEAFVTHYKDFFRNHPNIGEVRVVGHSLGTQMATYLTYRLYDENWNGPRPLRLELLDPYVGSQAADTGGMLPDELPSVFAVPPDADTNAPSRDDAGRDVCDETNRRSVFCALDNMLAALNKRPEEIAMVDYSSITGGATARHFLAHMHVQALAWDWLCSSALACPRERAGLAVDQHVRVVDAYFGSIGRPPPRFSGGGSGFNASVSRETILRTPRRRTIQIAGRYGNPAGIPLEDDTYQDNLSEKGYQRGVGYLAGSFVW